MPNNVDITAGTGTTISTTTVGSGFSAYSTSGQAATGILYCSANTSTAPTPVTNANPLPVSFQNSTLAVSQSGTWNVGTVTAVTSITNPVAATQSGTWTVSATQSGTWSSRLQDGSGNAVTSRVTGSSRPLEIAVVDASGNQITSFGGSGGTASNYGSTFPTSGTAVGYYDGTNMQGARVFDLDSGAGTQYVQGVNLRIAASGGSVEGGTSSNPIRTDPTRTTTQPVSATSLPLPTGAATAAKQPALGTAGSASTDVITVQGIASGVAQPVSQSGSWTVTANAGTGTLAVSLASAPLPTGASTEATLAKLAVSQSTALGSNTQTMVGGSVTTSAPTYTTGNINPLSLDTSGQLRVSTTNIGSTGGTAPSTAARIGATVGSTFQPVMGRSAVGGAMLQASIESYAGFTGAQPVANSFPVAIATDQTVFPTSQDSATLYAGTTALTPKFAVVTASASGDTSVIAAVTSKKIRVIRYSLSANGAVQAYFRSGAAGTAISGVKYMTQYGGAGGTYCPQGIFETASNTALVINLNGAVAVSGEITYLEV